MSDRKVIHHENFPSRFPLSLILSLWLLLKELELGSAWHGAYWCFVVIIFLGTLSNICREDKVDIFGKRY